MNPATMLQTATAKRAAYKSLKESNAAYADMPNATSAPQVDEHLLAWEKKNKKLRAADADFLIKVRKGELRLSEAVKGKVFYLQNSVLRHGYKVPQEQSV